MIYLKKSVVTTLLVTGCGSMLTIPQAQAEDAFLDALTGGKVSFSTRARYESVSQDNSKLDANAYTLRTTLGYKTGDFHGFGGFLEFENVSDLGAGHYNSKRNGKTQYSVVADPTDTEVNQGYLSYNGYNTEVKFGRQEITYRKAPFHRFIGNVLWRQNHQSFDAFSVTNKSLPDTVLNYAYLNKVHTILGTVTDMNSHLFNLQYSGLPFGKLEGYGYFLDYSDTPAKSSKTLGLRFHGAAPVSNPAKVIYTAEYANQGSYKDGTMNNQNYYLAELGGKYKGWLAKLSYEMQEGDGTYSFNTPLGTNHAYQGWADMFLSTPSKGLRDTYFTLVGPVLGAKFIGVYHDFQTDKDSLDAGSEYDLMLQKTFNKHYTLGVTYADYRGSSEMPSYVNTQKFWVFGKIKF